MFSGMCTNPVKVQASVLDRSLVFSTSSPVVVSLLVLVGRESDCSLEENKI